MSNTRLLNTRKGLRHINIGLRIIGAVGALLIATVAISFYTFFQQLDETSQVQRWLNKGAATFSGEVMHAMVASKDAAAAFTIFDNDDDIAERLDYADSVLKLIFTRGTPVGDALTELPSAENAKTTTLNYLRTARAYLAEHPRTDKTREQLKEAAEMAAEALQQLRIDSISDESHLRDDMMAAVSAGRMIAHIAIPAILVALLVLVFTVFVLRSTAKKWARAEEERYLHLRRLMASISNDLRTPLQAVMGATSLMASKQLPRKDAEKCTEIVSESANRLKQLVDDLFAMSRGGTIEAAKDPIRLSVWIRRAVVTHWIVAEQKGLQFELISNLTENVTVSFDESRLTQVVSTLLGNAIKYTKTGFVRVTVSWRNNVDERSGVLYITVEDSGDGITKQNKEWIWDPLVTPGELADGEESTGLGLAIVSEIAKSVGGQVTASSPSGKGGRFDVVMPLPLTTAEPFVLAKRERRAVSILDSETPKVLIVEEDDAVRHVLTQLVQDMGYSAQSTADGYQALQILRRTEFAVVVTDIQMTGMDSLRLAQGIHSDIPARPAIVAMTAHSGKEPALRYSRLFDAILFKPVSDAQLYDALSKLISARLRGRLGEDTVQSQPTQKTTDLESAPAAISAPASAS